jgi:trimethylamine:corrinoid methyltransferase-like protein
MTVSDQQQREYWTAQGEQDVFQRAHAMALELIANYEPVGLPADIDAKIKDRFKYIRDIERLAMPVCAG